MQSLIQTTRRTMAQKIRHNMQQLASRMHAVFALLGTLLSCAVAQAAKQPLSTSGNSGLMCLAVALGIGVATLGGTLGQSRAAAAALEGMARNPSKNLLVPLLLSLALIESLVLSAWVLMYFLLDAL